MNAGDPVATRILRRYEALVRDAATVRNVAQSLVDFIMPNRGEVTTKRAPGARRTDRVFDGTQIRANNHLASFIASTLTNLALNFFTLVVEDEALMNQHEVQAWLQDTVRRTMKWLRASNFATESQEMYRDLGGLGTGCLFFDERARTDPRQFNGFLFRAEPFGSYVITENPEGLVDTIYRKLELSPVQQARRWGVERLSERTRQKLETDDRDRPLPVIHAVFPREGGKLGFTRTRLPYASIFVDQEAKHVIAEGGYYEFPAMVPRWAKNAGEVYGRGPGHDAYPDIRTLNKVMELMFRAWGKQIDPPINVLDDAVIGGVVNQIPSGINVVRDLNAIQPWPITSRVDISQQLVNDLRSAIRSSFFSDQFQLPDKTIITATEVERRLEMMQQILGPTVGRLEWEFLSPMVARAIQIQARAGMLAPVPAALAELAAARGGVGLVVRYEGPLARSQRQSEVAAVERFLSILAPVSQVNPDTADVVNWDELVVFLSQMTGLPTNLIRKKAEIQQLRQARAQAAAAQQQMAAANVAADTGHKIAKAAAAVSGKPVALDAVQEGEAPVAENQITT